MDEDEAIFGQLDRLHSQQRGARDDFDDYSSHNDGYAAHDGYGAGYPPHDGYIGIDQQVHDEYIDEPMQLDAFGM